MAEISAAAVKALREETGLPMMECKKALQETSGDQAAAVEWLRKQGKKTQELRIGLAEEGAPQVVTDNTSKIGRETTAGRLAVYVGPGVGAIVEVRCESAPVAGSPEFIAFANDVARQLATGPGAASPEELLAQPALSYPGKTLGEQCDDMFNRIREVFKVTRVARIDAPCGGYAHHDGSAAALVELSVENHSVGKDVAMHVVAKRPDAVAKENLDPALVNKEREILSEAARKEGKPENIIAKMIEGRMKNFYAERALLEQPFIKDETQTIGKPGSRSSGSCTGNCPRTSAARRATPRADPHALPHRDSHGH